MSVQFSATWKVFPSAWRSERHRNTVKGTAFSPRAASSSTLAFANASDSLQGNAEESWSSVTSLITFDAITYAYLLKQLKI
jgi:hypothetical protein